MFIPLIEGLIDEFTIPFFLTAPISLVAASTEIGLPPSSVSLSVPNILISPSLNNLPSTLTLSARLFSLSFVFWDFSGLSLNPCSHLLVIARWRGPDVRTEIIYNWGWTKSPSVRLLRKGR